MDTKYVEIAVGAVNNRGNVEELKNLYKYIRPNREIYRSIFLLDESAPDHFKNSGTIKDYKGTYSLDKIIFDIDISNEIMGDSLVYQATCAFVEELKEMGVSEEDIRVWFSGRGFHIEIPDLFGFQESRNLPQIVKATIAENFSDIPDNIYDKGRIIKIGYSYNSKSGLYKTPLQLRELFNMDYLKIAELAKTIRKDYSHPPLESPEVIWNSKIVRVAEVKEIKKPKSDDYTANVTCIQKIYNEKDQVGKRHTILLRLINGWKRLGLAKEASRLLGNSWSPSLGEEEIDRIIEDVYKWNHTGYSCSDIILHKYCDPLCRFYKNKDWGLEIMNVEVLNKNFIEFMNQDLDTSSFDLQDIYKSLKNPYRFYPGELAVVIGDTKVGKTAWLQNICIALKNMSILYLSLEMGDSLMYRRFLQIALDKSKQDIYDLHYNESNFELIKSSIGHINIITVSPEIGAIKELVDELRPNIIVVDTLDTIYVDKVYDPFKKTEKVILGLREIANRSNTIILAISHISKGASRDYLDVHSAKGNSVIEQKADKILGIEGDKDISDKRFIKSIASRDEHSFALTLKFNYNTFSFKELERINSGYSK